MLKTILIVIITLLISAASIDAKTLRKKSRNSVRGDEIGYATNGLTTSPTAPIKVDSSNRRYFNYGGKRVALVGISGSYLPHVKWTKPNVVSPKPKESCGLHPLTNGVKKYIRCINLLQAAGLNVMRLWIGLNHSPGKLDGNTIAYDFEQPFLQSGAKWNFDAFDTTYAQNLYKVVKYAQDHGIIVEVTLFDAFDKSNSPWLSANHLMDDSITPVNTPCRNLGNVQFTDKNLFIRSENTAPFEIPIVTSNPPLDTTYIDGTTNNTSCRNYKMRKYQIKLARRIADVLNGKAAAELGPTDPDHTDFSKRLFNFYWELANEPDGSAYGVTQLANWHYFMAWQVREHEKKDFAATPHLIAVNYALDKLVDGLVKYPNAKNYIDIVEAHYIKKDPVSASASASSVEEETRAPDPITAAATTEPALGAITMIRKYNKYDSAGMPTANNNKIWGFNEGRWTGFVYGPNNLTPATPASARAEAWEFMFNAGGVLDHLGYNWANLPQANDPPGAEGTRNDLGRLSKFLNEEGLNLDGMRPNQSWLKDQPPYPTSLPASGPAKFYAAMNNQNTFLYYSHLSRYLEEPRAPRYKPELKYRAYTEQVTFKNPYLCKADFTAEWITPKNDVTMDIQEDGSPIGDPEKPAKVSDPFPLNATGTNSSIVLTSKKYNYDIVLRVKQVKLYAPCSSINPQSNAAASSNGAVATASSELDDSYPASSVIDGDRSGVDWGSGGGWSDGTSGEYPDWVQIAYPRKREVGEVDVFTLRDNFTEDVGINEDDKFSLYGITDFEVQYRDPETEEWITVPNGAVTGNENVWTRVTFDPVITDAIRVVVNGATGDHSRIVEIEVY